MQTIRACLFASDSIDCGHYCASSIVRRPAPVGAVIACIWPAERLRPSVVQVSFNNFYKISRLLSYSETLTLPSSIGIAKPSLKKAMSTERG